MACSQFGRNASRAPRRGIIQTVYVERLLDEKKKKYETVRTYTSEKSLLLTCGHIVPLSSYATNTKWIHCRQCQLIKNYSSPTLMDKKDLELWATPEVPNLICQGCQVLLTSVNDMYYIDEQVYCKECFDKMYKEMIEKLDKREYYE